MYSMGNRICIMKVFQTTTNSSGTDKGSLVIMAAKLVAFLAELFPGGSTSAPLSRKENAIFVAMKNYQRADN